MIQRKLAAALLALALPVHAADPASAPAAEPVPAVALPAEPTAEAVAVPVAEPIAEPAAVPAPPAVVAPAAPEAVATPAPAPAALPAKAVPAPAPVPAAPAPPAPLKAMGPLPTQVVDAYHEALAKGDRPAVLAQLSTDVLIYEQGFVEQGRDAYAEGSLPNDATFAGMVKREVRSREAWEDGNVAWVVTRSGLSGDFGEANRLELENTETILLRRTDLGWKIVHIHRSAHPRTEEEARP